MHFSISDRCNEGSLSSTVTELIVPTITRQDILNQTSFTRANLVCDIERAEVDMVEEFEHNHIYRNNRAGQRTSKTNGVAFPSEPLGSSSSETGGEYDCWQLTLLGSHLFRHSLGDGGRRVARTTHGIGSSRPISDDVHRIQPNSGMSLNRLTSGLFM